MWKSSSPILSAFLTSSEPFPHAAMAPTLLCTFLLAFLAILPTVSMAAPPSTVENDFLKRLDHSLRLDYDSWLATQFPQVPPAERRNIGVIPSNIKVSHPTPCSSCLTPPPPPLADFNCLFAMVALSSRSGNRRTLIVGCSSS